jgi:hypothetical protein
MNVKYQLVVHGVCVCVYRISSKSYNDSRICRDTPSMSLCTLHTSGMVEAQDYGPPHRACIQYSIHT